MPFFSDDLPPLHAAVEPSASEADDAPAGDGAQATPPAAPASTDAAPPPARLTPEDMAGATALEERDHAAFLVPNVARDTHGSLIEGATADVAIALDASSTLDGALAARALAGGGLHIDLEALSGWHGATLGLGAQGLVGDDGSADYGGLQGFSNIDAAPFTGITALQLDQQLGDVRLRVGRFDANADFAWTARGAHFLNPSAGFSPTITYMTTYPSPAWGGLAGVSRGVVAADAAVFAAAGDDGATHPFGIGQVAADWGAGRVSAGGWGYRDPQVTTGGAFATFEQALWRGEQTEHLALVTQAGWSAPDANPLILHVAAGLVSYGPLPGRPDDAIGAGASWVRTADGTDDVNVEAFVHAQLVEAVGLRLDGQAFRTVDGSTGGVVTLRTELSL